MYRVLTICVIALVILACSKKGELPETFSADFSPERLESEFELDEVWSVSHPEYEPEILILLTSVPVESMSPNYRVAFYQRKDEVFVKIDRVFEFGGYKPPELGRHPDLDVPAVVAEIESIPEQAYFFVYEGKIDSFHENEESWTEIK